MIWHAVSRWPPRVDQLYESLEYVMLASQIMKPFADAKVDVLFQLCLPLLLDVMLAQAQRASLRPLESGSDDASTDLATRASRAATAAAIASSLEGLGES